MHHRPFRLKPSLNFYQNRLRFWIGLFCGVGIAIAVFYFQLFLLQVNLSLAREDLNVLLQIPAQQLHWYVAFFTGIAFSTGSSVAFLVWLAQYRKAAKIGRRPWLYMAINDQANVLPSFLHVYLKLAFIILIWFLSAQWMATTNAALPAIAKVMVVLLPIALVLNQWINIRRFFRVRYYWPLVHLVLLVVVSFLGSFMPLPLEGKLQKEFVEKRPYLNLDIKYPSLACDDFSHQNYQTEWLAGDLYLGFEGGDTNAAVTNIYQAHPNWQNLSSINEFRNRALRQAHFDGRLPMWMVDSLVLIIGSERLSCLRRTTLC